MAGTPLLLLSTSEKTVPLTFPGGGYICDALGAVTGDTGRAYDASAPFCPEYAE